MRLEWSIAMNRRFPVRKRIAWNCCATRARTSARFSCCIRIRELAIDRILDEAAAGAPVTTLEDEYGVTHRVWKISDPAVIARIQALMADKKLLIADGHHRYETALAFRNENPGLKDAEKVMMTFVNMHSPGLEILATHRVLRGIPIELGKEDPRPGRLASIDELKQVFREPGAG